MNKDVIYVEPEDDITDIVTKVNNSKEKIVALVPPKKTAVFRSIVNIKLIAKAGVTSGKSVVLVTTDPAVIKLAAATKLPVTKNLQSAPSVPVAEEVMTEEVVSRETVTEEGGEVKVESTEVVSEEIAPAIVTDAQVEPENAKDTATDEKPEVPAEETDKKKKKLFDRAKKSADKIDSEDEGKPGKKEKPTSSNPVVAWIQKHKAITICSCVGVVALIIVLVWAFAIAPAATVMVGIRTTTSNFSENATFTTVATEENASAGRFYLVEKKSESKQEVEFTPTGKKNVGQKATGELVIYAFFRQEGAIAVNAGSIFTNNGLSYITEKDASLSWDGKTTAKCDNNGQATTITSGCLISARVPVVAEESGAKYNIAPNEFGWSGAADVAVYSDKSMAGGTDETITVVQQSDIDEAKKKLETSNETANKTKLINSIPEGNLVISSTFKQTVGDGVSTPAVGEKVEDGKKAKLSVTTTDTVYYVDLTKIEEFIREKAKLAENYKIYKMDDPFIENFAKGEKDYTGKVKASYVSGPEVTENNIIEIVKGKGVGTAQHDLSEISGIGKIKIETSFPWVSSVPNDPEKITVEIKVEE